MEQQRFDEITRALAAGTSRRALLRRLGAALGGALAFGATSGIAAPKDGNGGSPQGRCADGFTNCRGTCVSLLGDRDNCGACATACPDVTICLNGECACPNPDEEYVGGACYDLDSPLNCGSVGNVCSGNTLYCVDRTCVECLDNIDCKLGTATGTCQGGTCLCVERGGSGCDYSVDHTIAAEDCCRWEETDSPVFCNPGGVCGGPGAYCTSSRSCASGSCLFNVCD
jgi:hypothetical protein